MNPCLLHYCRVCNIQLNSCRQAKIHSEGKKHEKRLSYLKFCLESSTYINLSIHTSVLSKEHICKSHHKCDSIISLLFFYFSRFGIKPCGYYRGRSAIQQRSGRSAADTAASVRVQSYHGRPRGPTRGSPPSGYSRWHLLWATSGIGSSDELPQLLLPGPAAKFPAAASTADHAPE